MICHVRYIYVHVHVRVGHRPKANNGTLVTCHMKKGLNDRFWCCKLAEVGENQITVTVKSSINSLIGRWTMFAQTSFFVSSATNEEHN